MRQGDLIILKEYDDAAKEKGVILVSYTETIRRFAAVFRVEDLVADYMVVFEPSWWGYQSPEFLMLLGSDADVIIEAQTRRDAEFLERYAHPIVPVRIGAGDWVNPERFQPNDEGRRDYDVVMVSSWHPFKRHEDLFRALAHIKATRNLTLRTALIGYPNGWTIEDIFAKMDKWGVREQCDVHESIPQAAVADIVGRSRMYVLLSKREGANRALYEAMFCNTAVLVPRDHRGVRLADLNAQTGRTFERNELASALCRMLEDAEQASPRTWALANTGFRNANIALNAALKKRARETGRPWTRDIAWKKNEPNLLYVSTEDSYRFEKEYQRLKQYLRSD